MAWEIAAAAVISAGAGIYSSGKSAKEMKKMRRLMKRRLNFAKERWQHYRDTYGDIEKRMVADAERGYKADYGGVTGRAATDVSRGIERSRDAEERRQHSYGIDPSSGRVEASNRRYGLQEATGEAFAVNTARERERRRAEDETYRRRHNVYSIGTRLQDNAASDILQTQGDLAGVHGQSGQMYGELANNLFSQAGLIGAYGLTRNPDVMTRKPDGVPGGGASPGVAPNPVLPGFSPGSEPGASLSGHTGAGLGPIPSPGMDGPYNSYHRADSMIRRGAGADTPGSGYGIQPYYGG